MYPFGYGLSYTNFTFTFVGQNLEAPIVFKEKYLSSIINEGVYACVRVCVGVVCACMCVCVRVCAGAHALNFSIAGEAFVCSLL